MAIKKVEIICLPCKKCEGIETMVRNIVKNLEMTNKVKIPFEFTHTKTLANLTQLSVNPSQTPVLIINGEVESAGRLDVILLRRRLEAAHRSC